MNRITIRAGVLFFAALTAATSAAQEHRKDRAVFHEQEVGWATRQLAEVFGIAVDNEAFTRAVSELGVRASFGEQVTEAEVSKIMALAAKGVHPGQTTRAWINRMDLRGETISDDPEAGIIGIGSINCIVLPIADWLRANPNADAARRAMYSKALLLMLADTDYLTPSGLLFELRKPEGVDRLLLDDGQRDRLLHFKSRLEERSRATGQALASLVRVIQECRSERRPTSDAEELELIKYLDALREVGAPSQGDWRWIVANCHAILRLSGVPAEQEIDTRFARYLRQWESELPEGNVKRWLKQANTAGRDLEPVRIEDGSQLRPVAEP